MKLKSLLPVVALTAAGCAGLQPPQLPPEYTPAPAAGALWDSIEQARPGDWLVLLNDGPAALDWRLTAIDSATDSIELQTFLWTLDAAGSMVLDHILAAANRGVSVRLLIDDTFLLGEDSMLLALHRHPNIDYRVFNPYQRRLDSFASRALLNLAEFDRLDHRMHNKAMIIDNRVAIIGGRNLADEYFGLHAEANFRDMEVLIGGPLVLQVSASFDRYWNDRWSVPIDALSHLNPEPAELETVHRMSQRHADLHAELDPLALADRWRGAVEGAMDGRATLFADEPPGDDPASKADAPVQVANELVALFDQAVHDVVILSAYLIPTQELEDAVRRAVARGVRIRILTNSIRSNNHLAAHSAYRNHIAGLVGHGTELHEMRADARDRSTYMLGPVQDRMLGLHAKVLLVDDEKVFIGSANLDPRSLRINTEMGLLVESRDFNARIRAAVGADFHPANAWQLLPDGRGGIVWVSEKETRDTQPSASFMQDLEDWFFALLPIEGEL
jgi:putative cardiolipin synthase